MFTEYSRVIRVASKRLGAVPRSDGHSAKNVRRTGSPNQHLTSEEISMLDRISRPAAAGAGAPRFYSVAEVADMFGMSAVTLYRAIRAGEFPAVRIRGRLIVPAKAIEAMADVAMSSQSVVEASSVNELGEGA
jgi:excisionase family DNA binding protein